VYLFFNVWRVNITDCVIQMWPGGGLGLVTNKKQDLDQKYTQQSDKLLANERNSFAEISLPE